MLPYLLNAGYLLAAVIASPWLLYQALTKGKYREGIATKLLGQVPQRHGNRPCVWLHAVSVGEVNLLAPLLAELSWRFPDVECVVSTTTMTGYALARKKFGAERVFYAPLDFTWAVSSAMRRVRPSLLVLAELEVWPNLIRAAREQGAHVTIINGRLSERSFRGYQRLRRIIEPVLKQIDLIAVQTDEYANRFRELGANPTSVRVTGSLKYDGAQTNRDNPATQRLVELAGVKADDIVFLAGSTQEPEEAVALQAYRQLCGEHPRLKLVLVPRHPDRFATVARLLEESGILWQRRSELETQGANPEARVLLVDAMGELGAWWGAAQIAFVGGSLGNRGGQNMIEPAAYGAAVSFGPNTRNFRDIVAALREAEAAVVVNNGRDLTAFVRRVLEQPEFAARLGERAAELVKRHQGATARTVDLLEPFLAAEVVLPASVNKAA